MFLTLQVLGTIISTLPCNTLLQPLNGLKFYGHYLKCLQLFTWAKTNQSKFTRVFSVLFHVVMICPPGSCQCCLTEESKPTHPTGSLAHCDRLIHDLLFSRRRRRCSSWLLCSCSPGCHTTSSPCGQSLGTFPWTTSPSPSASSLTAWPTGTPASTPSFTLSSRRISARPAAKSSPASSSCGQWPLRNWPECAWRTSPPPTPPQTCKLGSQIHFRRKRREEGSVWGRHACKCTPGSGGVCKSVHFARLLEW